jgi:hypothetical protein
VPTWPAGQLHTELDGVAVRIVLELQPDVQAVKKGTPQMVLENPSQKLEQSITPLTLQAVRLPLKAVANLNMANMSVTLETAQDERSPLKAVANLNICHMVVTLETAQDEMSPLKAVAT